MCKKRKNGYYLYLYVTNDEFEIPLAVAGSGKELAELIGVSPHYIYTSLSKGLKRFKKVYIDEVDDED